MHLRGITEGDRTLIEWAVTLDALPQDADQWQTLFQSWIPEWTNSLGRGLGTTNRRGDERWSPRAVVVTVGPGAAENPLALRR
jgi:hypothetical protein